jgi:hypothetical protein
VGQGCSSVVEGLGREPSMCEALGLIPNTKKEKRKKKKADALTRLSGPLVLY